MPSDPLPPPAHGDALPPPHESAQEHGPGGFFLTGEYLLIKPRRRALDFAISDPIDNGIPDGVIESLDWRTQSGFRAGGGYRLPGENWEIGVYYTYFHSHDRRNLVAPPGGTLYATWTRPGTIEEVTSTLALTSLDYDVFDVEVGRRFQVGDSLAVRLFGCSGVGSLQ